MKAEVVDGKLLEFYANLAILVHDNFIGIYYKEAKSKKYPYSECLYCYFRDRKFKSNTANYFLNNIYYDETYKYAIDSICNERKKVKCYK